MDKSGEKKINSPNELGVTEIEKYVFWKINKHAVSHSYQRMIVASIDKFYRLDTVSKSVSEPIKKHSLKILLVL